MGPQAGLGIMGATATSALEGDALTVGGTGVLAAAAPHIIGRAVTSKPGQAYFKNQVLGGRGPQPDARTRALLAPPGEAEPE